jgi:hypothetical protein
MPEEADVDERTKRDIELMVEAQRIGAFTELGSCFRDVSKMQQGASGTLDEFVHLAFALRGLDDLYEEWWARRTDAVALVAALKRFGTMECAPPAFVYKYRSVATEDDRRWAYETIVGGTIYLASPMYLNDPFDCLPGLATTTASGGEMTAHIGTTMDDLATTLRVATRMSLGVFSTGAEPLSPAMWAHYADRGRGICIGFSGVGMLGFSLEHHRQGFRFRPVNYVDSLARVHWDDEDSISKTFSTSMWQKSLDWSYEREWRLLLELPNADAGPDSPKRVVSLPNLITTVIIGLAASDQTVALVEEWCRSASLPPPRKVGVDRIAGTLFI